ncbi:Hypothetical protein PHPALM_36395 [Phytophthora palmivora]|uniref:PiggyBac transposable element-derived protein domain-containing protein n=1 Tax=Phytophthora palmivora TaxID=4796 RepID=A0A2P4X030_9STRA|nr:Hypothetical protein PHPALM_36395 [Phytophthora palmivora]
MKTIEAHKLAVVIGLLIARMLCPHKRRLSSHWCVSSVGAIPAGTFGSWMPRNRFDDIMHHLHFADNNDPRAKSDRAWKIRPVIDTLQNTFKKGYRPGSVLSFDEGMIPSQSKFNGTRTFMRDKPHKWGTKLFLTCCPRTSYSFVTDTNHTIDDKSGPVAVLRNLNTVLPENRNAHHTVVIDRFYTSVALALELLAHKIYTVGTIQTQRIGFPSKLKDKRKKRPASIPRETYQVARSKAVPDMTVCRWWDSKPV